MNMLEGIYIPSRGLNINGDRYFIPASNTKIFTSFFALMALGEEYVFSSEYRTGNGTLFIKTMGNPLITDRDLDFLLDEISHPVNEIVLDINFLHPTERPPGWCIDDVGRGYAPPVSEINYNFNRIERVLTGKRVQVSVKDPVEHFIRQIRKGISERFGVRKLEIRYSRVDERGTPFAERTMGEMLKIMNKNSENIIAEMLLLHSGMKNGKKGLKNSLMLMQKILERDGITGFRLWDGSGLSYYNLARPDTIVKILEKLREMDVFVNSLPVGGRDGTLRERLSPKVVAKTGTLGNVQCLSGYIDGNEFSVMLNGVTDQTEAKNYIDRLLESI